MSFQSESIVVIGEGCDGAHGAGMRFGTNCACCAFEKLQGSFMAGGGREGPEPRLSIEKTSKPALAGDAIQLESLWGTSDVTSARGPAPGPDSHHPPRARS